ncbi:zinc finger CCHC domain-containing protein 3-like [Oncorhynchus keta]|uniref:zinc finger CCHC domain-containing protein 3-like n=1 Tax=Oncorhynchus keta TaxID=8018 RepID=UPI00227A4F9E|nr:zinc finger CCHC domain-containing protein 3-like [Oncorhynchus keta]
MAQSTSGPSVPGIGLANTVRFSWRGKEMEPWGRETFGRNILMGHLKLKVRDVLCLQGNPMEKGFDVTLYLEEKHNEIMKTVTERKEGPLCHYTVTSLARNNFRVVTITMYKPHVKDEEVRAFLGRYMDNVSSARYLGDFLGFWNGKRGFQALLRESPKSVDGYLHPPAMFSLGADRGTLYYARQPPFCRRCMAYGHTLASCSNKKCRFCGSEEHEARECDEPKACHGCGSREHLWRDCLARHRSYASAAGGGAGDGGRKERTRADCTDGTGERTEKDEEGRGEKKEE